MRIIASSIHPSTQRMEQVHQLLDIAVSDRINPERPQLRWAMYAQFAVPGWAVRSLPLSFHKARKHAAINKVNHRQEREALKSRWGLLC